METKKESQITRVLNALKSNGTQTNVQLNKICYRYGARIHELRADGYIIVTNLVRPGLFEFTFKGHVDDRREYGDSY